MPVSPRRITAAVARRLSRVTTSGRHIRELDGLRFVAIGAVFVQHVYQELLARHPAWAADGHGVGVAFVDRCRFAVDLFFVVSGFILGLPFAGQYLLGERPVPLRAYYVRRLTRLEPPYVLTMLLWFGVAVIGGAAAGPLVPHLLASLGYVHGLVYGAASPINPVAWSLEVEVQFYLAAPVLAAVVYRVRSGRVRCASVVVAAVVVQQGFTAVAHAWPPLLRLGGVGGTLLNTLPLFLLGMGLADVYLTRWRSRPDAGSGSDVAAVAGWTTVVFFFLPPGAWVPRSAWPFLLVATVAASLRGPRARRVLSNGFVVTVGGMCYSIYLLHVPLIRLLGWAGPMGLPVGGALAVYTAAWGAAVLSAAGLFFVLVERPCMDRHWPGRLLRRRVVVPASETAPLPSNQPVP